MCAAARVLRVRAAKVFKRRAAAQAGTRGAAAFAARCSGGAVRVLPRGMRCGANHGCAARAGASLLHRG